MIHTDEEDNLIIRTHIYDANKNLPIHEKVAMNVFVTGIEVDSEEVTFHHIVTEPILDDNCGVTSDAICDECITENLEDGTLLLFKSGDYIDGDKHIENSKKAWRRRTRLDGLVGEE